MRKPLKIVKLMGGFGNQMFQYAFGKSLQKETGDKVLYDLSYFEEAKKQIVGDTGRNKDGICIREYEIHVLPNIEIEIATKRQVKNVKKGLLPKFIKKILRKRKNNHYCEKNAFRFEKELLEIRGNAYYEGYFQNESYLNNIKEELKKQFELPNLRKDDIYNNNLINKIKQYSNSVFIHVRREDYEKMGCVVSLNYYKKAVKYIIDKIGNPKFFVFCAEDPKWIKENFNIGAEYELIGEQNKTRDTFFENMRLMMACKHAIIANSSYSWWAAWLSDFAGKIVVAPSPWMNNQDEIICHNWVKIENK